MILIFYLLTLLNFYFCLIYKSSNLALQNSALLTKIGEFESFGKLNPSNEPNIAGISLNFGSIKNSELNEELSLQELAKLQLLIVIEDSIYSSGINYKSSKDSLKICEFERRFNLPQDSRYWLLDLLEIGLRDSDVVGDSGLNNLNYLNLKGLNFTSGRIGLVGSSFDSNSAGDGSFDDGNNINSSSVSGDETQFDDDNTNVIPKTLETYTITSETLPNFALTQLALNEPGIYTFYIVNCLPNSLSLNYNLIAINLISESKLTYLNAGDYYLNYGLYTLLALNGAVLIYCGIYLYLQKNLILLKLTALTVSLNILYLVLLSVELNLKANQGELNIYLLVLTPIVLFLKSTANTILSLTILKGFGITRNILIKTEWIAIILLAVFSSGTQILYHVSSRVDILDPYNNQIDFKNTPLKMFNFSALAYGLLCGMYTNQILFRGLSQIEIGLKRSSEDSQVLLCYYKKYKLIQIIFKLIIVFGFIECMSIIILNLVLIKLNFIIILLIEFIFILKCFVYCFSFGKSYHTISKSEPVQCQMAPKRSNAIVTRKHIKLNETLLGNYMLLTPRPQDNGTWWRYLLSLIF